MNQIWCFISQEFADLEITLALHKLCAIAKRQIVSVAPTKVPIISESGLKYLPDLTLAEALQSEITSVEALLIPGGPLREANPELIALIQKFDRAGKLLAAICNGPQYLGHSGILQHHRFTTSASPSKSAANSTESPFVWENFCDSRVVCDGNVITAKGRAFIDFSFAIFDYLGVYDDFPGEQEQLRKDIYGFSKI